MQTDLGLGSRTARAWAIALAAVNERAAAAQAAHGTAVLVPPGRKQRAVLAPALLKAIAE